jgi:hypothetical protein
MSGQTHFDDPRWDADQTALDDHAADADADAEVEDA